MRKFLMVVAVGALALLMAAPAMAVDFKFGAEYRVRFYDYMNVGFDSNNLTATNQNTGNINGRGNPRGVQLRIRPRFDASDDNGNITATWRAEFGDTEFGGGGGANGSSFGNAFGSVVVAGGNRRTGNGAGGSIGADGVALETKWGYIDFQMPFGVPLRVRAGIQPWYLPKSLILDDDGAGVRAYGSIKPVSYEAFWLRATRSASTNTVALPSGGSGTQALTQFDTTRDSSLDYYGGKIDLAIAPFFNPGVYYVYGDNRANCSEPAVAGGGPFIAGPCDPKARAQHYVGFTVTGKVGIVDYDFDFVYGSAKGGVTGALGTGGVNTGGNANAPITVKGYAIDTGVHIPIGPVKFNLLGAYGSGDKQNGGDSEAFPLGPGPSWSGAGGQYELIGEGGAFDVVSMTTHGITNMWMLGATVEYVPVKPLWIKFAYGYAGFAQKKGNCAFAVAGSTGCFGPAFTSPGFVAGGGLAGQGTGGLAGKATLGHEIHLRADYTMWTGFKVQGLVGWLIPSEGDTAGKYILQLLYNF